LVTLQSRHADSRRGSNAIANDIHIKDIIKRIDLDQLTPPKLTAHLSDSLRRIFLMGNKIAVRGDARPVDSVSVSGFLKGLVSHG
jgi:hypothetical protein